MGMLIGDIDGAENSFYLSGLWQENRLFYGRIDGRSTSELSFLQTETDAPWPHVGRHSEGNKEPGQQERKLVKLSGCLKREHLSPTLNSLPSSFAPNNVSAGHWASCRSGYLPCTWFDRNLGHNNRFHGRCSFRRSSCKVNRLSMWTCYSPPFGSDRLSSKKKPELISHGPKRIPNNSATRLP